MASWEEMSHHDLRKLVGRSRINLKGSKYSVGQILAWFIAEIMLVLGVALPFWGRYTLNNPAYTEFGHGVLEVNHGIWQVCVRGVGSDCFKWDKMVDIDPNLDTDLHFGIQISAGLAIAFSVLAGLLTLAWVVTNAFTARKQIYGAILCKVLTGLASGVTIILYGIAYKDHILQGWCLFLSMFGCAAFFGLAASAVYYLNQHPTLSKFPTKKLPKKEQFSTIDTYQGYPSVPAYGWIQNGTMPSAYGPWYFSPRNSPTPSYPGSAVRAVSQSSSSWYQP